MLWRVLEDVSPGFYIDVGAQHPVIDSVSKAFYEHDWRGIHLEPSAEYAQLLRADRPDETVIQAIVAAQTGVVPFYEIAGTGIPRHAKTLPGSIKRVASTSSKRW